MLLKKVFAAIAILFGYSTSNAAAVTVTVTVGAQSYLYDCAAGTYRGDYIDPQGQFVQSEYDVSRTDTSLTVHCRPDTNSSHYELVFENFKAWGAANAAAAHVPAYSVVVQNGSTVVGTFQAQATYWGSRWRAWSNDGVVWQIGPGSRPVRSNAAALIANRLVAPLKLLAWHTPDAIDWTRVTYLGPMGNAGVNVGMPSTGARPDIGLVTEWVAAYLLDPTPDALAGVLAIAETSGSIPLHLRDETTDAPIDFTAHPHANSYWDPRPPEWIKVVQDWRLPVGSLKDPWQPDYAHHPDLFYVAFQLTGDPYFLEEGQYTYIYFLADKGPGPLDANGVHLIPENQGRGWAWMLRDLLNLVTITPDTTPSWLISKSVLQRDLDANLAHVTTAYANNPAIPYSVFRYGPQLGTPGLSFSDSFQSYVLSYAVYRGFASWQPIADWKWAEIDARLNGTSGWDHQTPSVYTNPQITTENNWAELYATWFSINKGGVMTPHTNATDYMQTGYWEYLGQLRFAAGMAKLVGLQNADYDFSFADHMTSAVNFNITAALSLDPMSATAAAPAASSHAMGETSIAPMK